MIASTTAKIAGATAMKSTHGPSKKSALSPSTPAAANILAAATCVFLQTSSLSIVRLVRIPIGLCGSSE